MGLLRLLSIIFIVYLVFRLVARFLFPLLAKYFVKKAQNNMEEQVKARRSGEKIFQEGDVEIRRKSQSTKQNSNTEDGDYIDYEEID